MVAGDAGTYRDAHPAQPLLVVEMADSSYRIDHEWAPSYPRTSKTCVWVEEAT